MHPAGVVASLLALLVTNGTSVLDCVCVHLNNVTDYGTCYESRLSLGESRILWAYCQILGLYTLTGACWTLEPPSAGVSAVARLAASIHSHTPRLLLAEEETCAGALAHLRRLTWSESEQLLMELGCRIAADSIDSCSALGLNDMEWNMTRLQTDHLRRSALSQSLYAVRRITTAIYARGQCELYHQPNFLQKYSNKTELQTQAAVFHKRLSNYWRTMAELFALGVTHVSQMFVPLAFEQMGNHTSDQRLHTWIKDVEHVKDMLHTKLIGWAHDAQSVSKQIAHYKVEEDNDRPGYLILRRPLLNDGLLLYQLWFLSFCDDLSVLCEKRQPEASQMFGLADALYTFYHSSWYSKASEFNQRYGYYNTGDKDWQLEDRSNTTLSVDTDCLQLLANTLDHPTCPLEDLPFKAIKQCRVQLWHDMVQRTPHLPVTSYLAYTQRANVNFCLLAWMTVNSFSICQDIPFSIIQSVHDAHCYFDSPDDQSCLEYNATDSICSVSRAVLLLKCRDFSSFIPSKTSSLYLYPDGSYSETFKTTNLFNHTKYHKPTEKTLNYKNSLNSATLKYKDFKIVSLKSLEITFILVNIIFRFSTAGIYMYFTHLCNLPGKIFLSFQITCIIQILCSEILYRMAGVPNLSTAVLIDSALTLLSCIWLNSFCYQMYACVRHLRLPNDLLPDEASNLFRRQVLYVLIPWTVICVATIAFETTSKYYLIHSRIVFLVAISVSVAFNLVCLGLVGYMYLRTWYSMRQLRVIGNSKFATKKQTLFMSFKAIIISGIGIVTRLGFHQVQGIAQFVYYVHIATMVQGPVLFVCFVCNGMTLPIVKNRLLQWWNPTILHPEQELCSAAERNLARRNNELSLAAESSL